MSRLHAIILSPKDLLIFIIRNIYFNMFKIN